MPKNKELIILLAEDDEGHAYLVQENLSAGGIANKVVHVCDGQEALDYLRSEGKYRARTPNGPLVVLLDINMPRVDGIEVLRQVRKDPHLAKLPVIMLTTTDDPREVRSCYELGCSSYVTKPVDYDRFVEAVRRLGLFLAIVEIPREDQSR
jgi:CheY-like chemotaxis protein